VGGKRYRPHVVGVSREPGPLAAALRVPKRGRAVPAPGGQRLAVRGYRHARHGPDIEERGSVWPRAELPEFERYRGEGRDGPGLQGSPFLARGHLPQLGRAVRTAAGQGLAVGGKVYRERGGTVFLEGHQLPARSRVPQLDGVVVACRGKSFAFGRELDRE